MENKFKKKSINTVIYLLLSAMLVSVVAVSVFTVASRRNIKTPVDTNKTTADSKSDTHEDTSKTDSETAQTASHGTADTGSVQSESSPSDTGTVPETKPASAKADEDVEVSKGMRYFVIPVAGTVSKDFEIDIPVYSLTMNDYRAHTGVDIAAPVGCEVISASSGTVCKVWSDPLMGKCVTLDHGDGIYTTYMNMAEELSPDISVGARVSMGQTLGAVGETSLIEIAEEPHLHLEMKVNGAYVDPLEYMGVASPQEAIYGE